MTETRSGFHRTTPECVVLPVKQGATPSPKPPVRIFIGTEPAQFRPERVLMWSIEQVRDPGRVYEIYLMKDLSGYRKWFWTTSFTNYRFAIPHYAGGRGRAIYNDEDQIYLGDPAELFDMDMGDHGYLTISDRDTAVMLIDCERMARVWTLRDAQRSRKHALLDLGVATGECGPLPPEWHARDDPEFVEGRTRLLHYTTLHTQPWRPYPERFIYRDHPLDHLWFSLEASANRAGFQVFTRERPSVFWRGRLPAIEADGRVAAGQPAVDESIRDLIRRAKAKTVLLVTPGASGEPPLNPEAWEVQRAVRLSPTQVLDADPEDDRYDGVACTAGLEEVPIDDVAWVIDALFQRAAGFVFAAVRSQRPARHWITPPAGTVHTPEWWVDQFDAVAARYPNVHWELLITGGPQTGSNRGEFRQGGPFLGDALPRVWVLLDGKPGHTTQSLGLAEELGWPYERVQLDFTHLADLPNAFLGESRLALTPASAGRLRPPWPDLVVACGRRTAPVSRWIRRQSRGRTRIVQLGRMGVTPPAAFDLSVVPTYARLLPHPQQIQTVAPLTRVRGANLDEANRRWSSLFDGASHPRIALLVGGNSPHYRFTPELARRLGADVTAMAEAAGGTVFATTSRRTPEASAKALEAALPGAAHVFRWTRDRSPDDNPYLGFLALADAFVVTGESASMLAEACATGNPVFIYSLPRGVPGWKGIVPRLIDRVVNTVFDGADARPKSRRGITRPQRGLELFFSKLLARGIVKPSCDFRLMHDALVEQGLARRFDGAYSQGPAAQSSDLPQVAEQVRRILGVRRR
jgi:mitochondrial fission protein ELM1